MSRHNLLLASGVHQSRSAGFTLVELLVSIVLISIISSTFFVFFKSSLFNYLDLQKDATSFTQLGTQAARVANVLRGSTDIISADTEELEVYAYFFPSDAYVSQLRYYVTSAGGTKQLKADLTPMSSNPPIGTPITAELQTFVVIDRLYLPSGSSLFEYTGSDGTLIGTPVVDLHSVKNIRIKLATETESGNGQAINVEVSLRNRKTNL